MKTKVELYFKTSNDWREWLHKNHACSHGIYLIFYKVGHANESMRWEEAVRVALCYGWIDSTVKSLGGGKRRQYFCPRKSKSVWSKVNKNYITVLMADGSMHQSGLDKITAAKKDGSWTALDAVENSVIPSKLLQAFEANKLAFNNYKEFSKSYQKSYLYWLNQAKREDTRAKRITEIIRLCEANIKSRSNR